jgi:putative peptidoglycan lipid II flippase
MKTPVKIAFLTVLVTQILAVTLMFQIGHAGLTLATSLGACLNATLLFLAMRRRGIYAPQRGWPLFLGRVFVALVVLGGVLWWAAGVDGFWVTASLWVKVGRLSLVILAGVLAYFAALWLVGFRFADFNRREHH